MNVAGISTTPAPPVAPAVTRVQPGDHTETRNSEQRSRDEARQEKLGRMKLPDPPKMKPLSTEEVQVILGKAPPELLLKQEHKFGREEFDGYA